MKSLLLLLSSFIALHSSFSATPNIVLINIDDLGYADVGPFGAKIPTPNLDLMAKEGMKLMSHYAAPVCSPSRAAMMTGCYPKRVLPIPSVLFPAAAVGLNPNATTVAEVLKGAGYATACIGKWHLGDQPEFLPTSQGFDHYFGIPYSNDMGTVAEGSKSNPGQPLPKGPAKGKAGAGKGDADPETGIKGNAQPPLPLVDDHNVVERVKAEQQHTFTRRYTERAVKYIRENQKGPFFLYLPHNAVHFPLYPHKDFIGKSGIGLQKDWAIEVDWSVGQVLDTLRELKLEANTLVIFTSDNGGPLNHGADNTPLRGGKGSTLEGGIRVCTIAWWPGKIAAGTKTDEITAHMDWLPTFGALAHCKSPGELKLDGKDISPILLGQTNAAGHDVFHYYRGYNLEAVRSGPWKLHLAKNELYNLDSDIGEATNVAAEHADEVAKLQALADIMKLDLGDKTKESPGVREMGRVEHPQPLISADGTVRAGYNKIAKTLP
ncbi:MAG: sulfatase [Prosthecobacter sp.]|uniref:sulfatase family protein n=1 Tax=Prosthecobacter sp. TaxID=1965333 RepID=UPI0025E3A8F3|nr:sulfatase [Prosthecobacter sp.]MCF7786932.1 sulfatase [Prosthecobacter sp.]